MDIANQDYKPVLTEPGVKYFIHQTLKQCHIIKKNFHNLIFNVGLFIAFLLILGLILFYKYKGKLTPIEIEKMKKEKQQYILSKIQNFQQAKRKAHQELITGLPAWESEYDIIHSKYHVN
jgi:ribosomal protein S1